MTVTEALTTSGRRAYQVCTCLYGIGLLLLGFWLRLLSRRPQVIVLGYHSISNSQLHIAMPVADFERQMRWLHKTGIPVLTLKELISFIAGRNALSRDAVVITFDDGFRDNLTNAFPILRRFDMPAFFFIPTLYAGDCYRWDRLSTLQQHDIMNWKDIELLAGAGNEIGSHGVTHARFSSLSPNDVEWELRESAAAIEKRIGQRPIAIAYPYGDMGDTATTVRLAELHGYRLGFTIAPAPVLPGAEPLRLPRYMVDRFSGRDPLTTFVLFLTCLFGTFRWYESLGRTAKRIFRYLLAGIGNE